MRASVQLVDDRGRKYLTADERARFIRAAAHVRKPVGQTFVLTIAHNGARVSEVLALRALDVDLDAGAVRICTLKRRVEHWREVPIRDPCVVAISAVLSARKWTAGPVRLLPGAADKVGTGSDRPLGGGGAVGFRLRGERRRSGFVPAGLPWVRSRRGYPVSAKGWTSERMYRWRPARTWPRAAAIMTALSLRQLYVAVGTRIAARPPHRSGRGR